MRLAIVGTRNPSINFYKFSRIVSATIRDKYFDVDTIVSGGAVGIDTFAKRYAEANNIKYVEFKPDYKSYGKVAPLLRNTEIVDNSDMLIAFPSIDSKGTYDSIRKARKVNKLLDIITI